MGNRNATHATTARPSSVACVVVDIMPPSSILCKKNLSLPCDRLAICRRSITMAQRGNSSERKSRWSPNTQSEEPEQWH